MSDIIKMDVSATEFDAKIDAAVEEYFEERRTFSPEQFAVPGKALEKFRVNYELHQFGSRFTWSLLKPSYFMRSPGHEPDLPLFLDPIDQAVNHHDRIESVKRLVQIIMLVRNHTMQFERLFNLFYGRIDQACRGRRASKVEGQEVVWHNWTMILWRLRNKVFAWGDGLGEVNRNLKQLWLE